MEVLNHKQRSRAYWFFVLFFAITVAVLVSAIFFNAYFPFKENSLLKKENAKMQKEMEIQDKFSFQLEKVKVAVDSMGMPNQNDFFNEKDGNKKGDSRKVQSLGSGFVIDADKGFILFDWMTMGQILTTPMILGGLVLMLLAYRNDRINNANNNANGARVS